MDYTLIRSGRKTVSIQLRSDGTVIVRAPRYLSQREIQRFVDSKSGWIEKRRKTIVPAPKLTPEELDALTQKGKEVFPERAAFYARQLGVTYEGITVRHQKTRWGSCSARGHLNFNCLLLLAPPEVLDSVVVHELCHRLEMNHSARFYAHIYSIFPDYDLRHRWLKEHGSSLIARLP